MTAIPYEKLNEDYLPISTAITGLETFSQQAALSPTLYNLIKLRASQINGCHFCMAMHCGEAREHGESQRRLDLLSAWRESDYFSDKEKLVLAWTETLTVLGDPKPRATLQEQMIKEFSEAQFMAITALIIAINSWNRLALSCNLNPKILPE